MKSFRFACLLMLLSAIIGCKDDDDPGTGSLSVNFKAVYQGLPLNMFSIRPFENGQQIDFSNLSFFISDLHLSGSPGSYTDEIPDLIDLSFDLLSEAETGVSIKMNDIKAGSYNNLEFGFGVPPDLNAQQPQDFPSTHPLSNNGYYWEAWNSYIFSKMEGRLDTIGNGTLNMGFALHTGANNLYRVLQATLPIVIEDGKETNVDIWVDYKALLEGVDIKSDPQNHDPADSIQIQKIVNNLADAITLVQ